MTRQMCQIESKIFGTSNDYAMGTGTFILPFLVLTAAHVVNEAEPSTLTFTNSEGHTAKLLSTKRGGIHSRNKDMDVALLELDTSIGPKRAMPVQTNSAAALPKAGFLCLNFGKNAGIHVVDYSELITACMLVKRRMPSAAYDSPVVIKGGNSGSPILDQQGRIVSVLSHSVGLMPLARKFSRLSKILPEDHKTFLCAHPSAFSGFMLSELAPKT